MRLRKRTYSIPEVAALTGLTVDAVRGRVKRGSLASIVKDGRRRIPHAELVRAGLLAPEAQNSAAGIQAGDSLPERLSRGSGGAGSTLAELLDRLERQSVELAHYRALEAASGNARLLQELAQLQARVAALEGAPEQRALPAGGEADAKPPPERSAGPTVPTELSRLWLPPTAGTPPATAHAGPSAVAASRQPPLTLPTLRAARFAVEALLILGAALGSWLAGFGALGIVLVVGAVWLIVAIAELAAWQLETG